MSEKDASNMIVQTNSSKSKVIKSLVWKFMERGGVQGVQFVIQIVLARLLCPDDYGILAILTAFIALTNVFVQSGFNTALIQKKDTDEADFSSVFWLSLLISGVMYVVLWFLAPFIAAFYHSDILTPVLRVLSLVVFFNALNSVQNAMVSKTMQFKRLFFSSMGGALGSGTLGIFLAYQGFGVWALAFQQLANSALICVILWVTLKWRPHLLFSWKKVKVLFSFGWKLLCSALLDTGYKQLYSLVIGRVFTRSDLGVFNRGEQFPQVITTNLDGSIQSVMLPTLSAHNSSPETVKRLARRSISTSTFILMPCMFGLAAVAKPLVLLLLTEKWLPCVPFLQLSCLSFALYPIHTANLTAINAMGHSEIYLKLEIMKKAIGLTICMISIQFGLIYMAIGRVCNSLISTFINAHPNKKILNYSYLEQWKDILPSVLIALVMAGIVFLIGMLELPALLLLIIQGITGVVLYVALAKLFKLEVYQYLLETIKGFKRK